MGNSSSQYAIRRIEILQPNGLLPVKITSAKTANRSRTAHQDQETSLRIVGVAKVTVPRSDTDIVASVSWFQNLVLGQLGTSLAIVAVASMGLGMLGGHLPARHAARVLAGIFLLFGAPVLASGLLESVQSAQSRGSLEPPTMRDAMPTTSSQPYDPYAGAAVPRTGGTWP